MAGYYDFILGSIPLTLGGLSGFLSLVGVELTVAVVAASLVAVVLVGHAMFVRAPVDSPVETAPSPAAPGPAVETGAN